MSDERCKEMLRDEYGFHRYPCNRKATRDGYCGIHHPDAKAKREAKREVAMDVRQARYRATWAVNEAERAVLDAVRAGDALALVTATAALHDADTALAKMEAET